MSASMGFNCIQKSSFLISEDSVATSIPLLKVVRSTIPGYWSAIQFPTKKIWMWSLHCISQLMRGITIKFPISWPAFDSVHGESR